jgi:hypothetical protein
MFPAQQWHASIGDPIKRKKSNCSCKWNLGIRQWNYEIWESRDTGQKKFIEKKNFETCNFEGYGYRCIINTYEIVEHKSFKFDIVNRKLLKNLTDKGIIKTLSEDNHRIIYIKKLINGNTIDFIIFDNHTTIVRGDDFNKKQICGIFGILDTMLITSVAEWKNTHKCNY